METLPAFRLLRPATVAEALDMHRENPGARYMAGGTDLMVNMRHGLVKPETVIDITGIDELQRIEATDAGLVIGAGVTLARLTAEAKVGEAHPVLATAAGMVAASTHRQVATLGGNLCLDTRCIFFNQSEWWRASNAFCRKLGDGKCHVAPTGERCHAAYCGDLAPALLVLGAEVDVAGHGGVRTLPLEDLYADDGAAHLRLAEGDLLTAVRLPPATGVRAAYEKVRVRQAVDFPLAGIAVALERQGSVLTALRVALTGTNPRPLLIGDTGSLLGAPLDAEALTRLEKLVRRQIQPMRNTTIASHYRRRVACTIARRLATRLYEGRK